MDKVDWYIESEKHDSLAVFAKNGRRGYFNIFTREIAISPIYRKAWVFSDGVAAVVTGDSLYYIDNDAKPLFGFHYYKDDSHFYQNGNNYCFHKERCIMYNDDKKYGLIDLQGKWIIAPEYDDVGLYGSTDSLYTLKKDDKYGVANANGKLIFPCTYKEVEITEDGIFVSLEDNMQRHLDFEGNMTDEFMCHSVFQLEYDTFTRIRTMMKKHLG